MLSQYLKYFFILVPNFPAFIPVPGAIVNFWILFLVFKTKFHKLHLFILILLCIWTLGSTLIYQHLSLKYAGILFLPLLLLMCFDQSISVYLRVIKFIFIFMFFLGICSLLGFDFLNIFLKQLFGDRAGLSVAAEGIRGVGLIYPEPSHAAPILILIFHHIFTKNTYFCRGYNQIILFSMIIFLFYILRSGSLSLYLSVYLVSSFAFLDKSLYKKLTLFVFVGLIIFIGYVLFREARFFRVFETLITLIVSGELSLEKTALISSGRFISNYVWIKSGLLNYIGLGLEFTVQDFISHSENLGVNYEVIGAFQRTGLEQLPVLPRSWLAVVVGAFGYIGVCILVIIFYLYWRILKKNNLKVGRNEKPLLVFAMFYLLVVGFPGNPIPWLTILLCGGVRKSSQRKGLKPAAASPHCGRSGGPRYPERHVSDRLVFDT